MPQRLLGVEQVEKICTEAKSSATQAFNNTQPIIHTKKRLLLFNFFIARQQQNYTTQAFFCSHTKQRKNSTTIQLNILDAPLWLLFDPSSLDYYSSKNLKHHFIIIKFLPLIISASSWTQLNNFLLNNFRCT